MVGIRSGRPTIKADGSFVVGVNCVLQTIGNELLILVWPTSWTPALGSLIVCECVCPRTCRNIGRRMMNCQRSNPMNPLKSIYGEWLIMKL